MSSLYAKKQAQLKKDAAVSQGWNRQDSIAFHQNEFTIPDFRLLEFREDEDGDRINYSSDPSAEIVAFGVTKPSSGSSVYAALKEKRAIPIILKCPQNYIAAYEKANFWQAAATVDISDEHLQELSALLASWYRSKNIVQSLYDYLDEEAHFKARARLKAHRNKKERKQMANPLQPRQ